MSSLTGTEPSAREFGEILPLMDVGLGPSIDELSATLLAQIPDSRFAPLIANPDVPGASALSQIDAEFSLEHDSETWKNNVVLLVGMAAFKMQQTSQRHVDTDEHLLILGQKPTDIIKDYFDFLRTDLETATAMRMPLAKTWPHLAKNEWFRPESSETVLNKLKTIANQEFIDYIFRMNEDPELLNAKVAYLWSGETHWPERYLLPPAFHVWLADFRAKARTRVVATTLEQIDKSNNSAFEALHLAISA